MTEQMTDQAQSDYQTAIRLLSEASDEDFANILHVALKARTESQGTFFSQAGGLLDEPASLVGQYYIDEYDVSPVPRRLVSVSMVLTPVQSA